MMNLFYLGAGLKICGSATQGVWTLIGYIILGIQIAIPVILIISGMITMAKAIMEKKEEDIKKAQNLLIKKVIAAIIAFLVIFAVKVVVGLVGSDEWQKGSCSCVLHPVSGTYDYDGESGSCNFNKNGDN